MGPARHAVLGVFLAGGAALFAVGLFMIGDRRLLFVDRFVLHTEFERVTGIQVGTKVRVAGLDAGEVLDVTIPARPSARFRVTMRVREDLHPLVRTDSVAAMLTDGLLGSVFIQIGRGSDEAPPAPPDSTILGQDAIEFSDLIQEGRDTFRTVAREVVELKDNVGETIDALTATIETTNGLVATVGGDVERIAKAGTRMADEAGQIVAEARGVVEQVKGGRGTVGRLLTDDALYVRAVRVADQAEQTVANVRKTTESLQRSVDEFSAENGPAQAAAPWPETMNAAQ